MPMVIENAAGLYEDHCAAVDAQRRAGEFLAEVADHFEGRGLTEHACMFRNICARHELAFEMLKESEITSPCGPWSSAAAPREFTLRVLGSRQLLEVALEMEREALTLHDSVRRNAEDLALRTLHDRLFIMTRDNVGTLVQARAQLPGPLDWEQLMAAGTMPSLPLGAERRLRRSH